MAVKFYLEPLASDFGEYQYMSGPQFSCDQEIGNQQVDMLYAKLWDNPCPMTFRINYLALQYNTRLYDWVQQTYGLKRPEYVVLYSLSLADGGSARDVSRTSGFPKNTLSRAIKRLELMELIERRDTAPVGDVSRRCICRRKGGRS